MALHVTAACIGCGACELACSAGAITQGTGYAVVYEVNPLACNDCGDCPVVCPVAALVPDPAWAVCHGRGCPLSSHRYAGWQCSTGSARCPTCGSVLWRPPGGDWTCSRCRLGTERRGARCPKVGRLETAPG